MDTALTVSELKAAIPPHLARGISSDVVQHITHVLNDPDMEEIYRDNLVGFASVVKSGKYKVSSYVNAVTFVSYQLMGKSNVDAYSMTFPDKVNQWLLAGRSPDSFSSNVAAYNKTKLVGLVQEQSMIPIYVANRSVLQDAINTQAQLMVSAKSEMVRSNAANSLILALKPPEKAKLELDVTLNTDSAVENLRQATESLVAQQRASIQAGSLSAKEVAHTPVIINQKAAP